MKVDQLRACGHIVRMTGSIYAIGNAVVMLASSASVLSLAQINENSSVQITLVLSLLVGAFVVGGSSAIIMINQRWYGKTLENMSRQVEWLLLNHHNPDAKKMLVKENRAPE